MVLSTLDELDFDKFEVDILIYNEAKSDWAYKFENYGCKIIKIPRARKGLIRFIYNQYKIIKEGNYDIVHAHTSQTAFLSAISATFAGIKVKICHSHFDGYPQYKYVMPIIRFMYNILPCTLVACSDGAGKALYGNKNKGFTFIKNGIDTSGYAYNETKRREIRKALNIEDKFVIGNVARLSAQKNHSFLLEMFKKVAEIQYNSVLLLVGDGELKEDIKAKIKELNLEEKVVMLGSRNDVQDLLQAMDVFVLPTLFEGLSLALLEVQCSGLYCITSDVVPKEVKVTDNFEFIQLNEGSTIWAKKVLEKYPVKDRKDMSEIVRMSGFGKREATKALEKFYLDLLSRKN